MQIVFCQSKYNFRTHPIPLLLGTEASRGYGQSRMLDTELQGAESRGWCYIALSPEMAPDMWSSRGDYELLGKRESKQGENKTEGKEAQTAAVF